MAQKRQPTALQLRNGNILDWYDTLVFALGAVIVLFLLFGRVGTVDGHSMEPTLQDMDRVVLQTSFFSLDYGDVVMTDSYIEYGVPLCKRVIAKGGDTVDIDFDAGIVYRNGQALDEPYIAEATRLYEGTDFPITVPVGQVFLMGDNRMHSTDSRSPEVGCIDERDILGEVLFRVLPVNKIGMVE